MSRLVDSSHVAILYETITGQCQKRGSIHPGTGDTVDVDAFLARHPGLQAIILSRSQLPAGVDQVETFLRQAVATATGKVLFPRGADRAVQVDASNKVSSVHYGNVPGLDKPDPGHQMVSHAAADIGDTFAAGVFSRRYAVINMTLGTVLSTPSLPLGTTPTLAAGQDFIASTSLTIGQTVILKTPSV